MDWFLLLLSVALFVYLMAAMYAPEKF
ncbi:K(+)-transporting ATPase subunit F [Vibrio japonicus]